MKIISQLLFMVRCLLDWAQFGALSYIHLTEPILRIQAHVEFPEMLPLLLLPMAESWTVLVTLRTQMLEHCFRAL